MAKGLLDNRDSLEEVLDLLGPRSDGAVARPATLLEAIQGWSLVALELASDASGQLAAFGLAAATDRAAVLVIADAGKTRPAALARRLGLSPAGSTSLIDRLVRSGLVLRERGTRADGRAVTVRLTAHGKAAVAAYLTVFQRHRDDVLQALDQLARAAP